jgi:kynurenine formamidase
VPALDAFLAPGRLVDLTQPLGPETPLWPGSRPLEAEVESDHDTDGLYLRNVTLPEHAGTHLDAPAHYHPGGSTTELVPLEALVRPAVCLDVRERVGDDPRFALGAAAIEELEQRDGPIPAASAVLVCTGWDRFLGDPRYGAESDPPSFPGLARDAARLLLRRGVAGIGIDTLGVDPGHVVEPLVHRITLPAGLWHLEGLVNLDLVPARGAWLVVGVLPLVAGSGAPARAFAVLP